MKIYNTLSRQKEEFKPVSEVINIYVCGPTVYNYIHIGNARPICVFDTLRRYLKYRGQKVNFVQNYTDVDDKIIRKANEENVMPSVISEKYINEFVRDAEGLGAEKADISPKVTENMDAIIALVKTLTEKGFAYELDGDVYFRTEKFKDYGKLSHMPVEDLISGARIDVNDKKESPLDFCLWKTAKPGEPFWESPWGKGRPGWHIECSAMAGKFLGDTIDIHCGGQDLIFPHHENEIAQSEAATGHIFANYWMHNGFINIDSKKMSKSIGNIFTVREISDEYGYEPIRFLMLQAHYRSPINYTDSIMKQCISSLERLYNFKKNLEYALDFAPLEKGENDCKAILLDRKKQFIEAMEDDLNTADAIAAIFELVRDVNPFITGENITGSKEYLNLAKDIFNELTSILGILNKKDGEIPQEIIDLAEQRSQARKSKNFEEADKIRNRINELGYTIEETRQGVKISKNM